jgi:5-methyltetrahydrofolate--homocysteine methyltransferase
MPDKLQELKKAIVEGEDDLAVSLVQKALKKGSKPLDLVNKAIVPGIQEAGDLWKKNVYFQSDIVMSAEAFHGAMEVVKPLLTTKDTGIVKKVVIGTVAGDIHNLGKIIVIAMLQGAGFHVIDLGEDVPTSAFIDAVNKFKPDILGLGCYMTTTMQGMKEVVKNLKNNGLRDHVKVLIGGVPTSQEFADELGADGWGKDALDAVYKAKQLSGVN